MEWALCLTEGTSNFGNSVVTDGTNFIATFYIESVETYAY
jgi:hypothetical protein